MSITLLNMNANFRPFTIHIEGEIKVSTEKEARMLWLLFNYIPLTGDNNWFDDYKKIVEPLGIKPSGTIENAYDALHENK